MTDHFRPRRLVFVAICLLFLNETASVAYPLLLSSVTDPVTQSALMRAAATILKTGSLILLIHAAFADRDLAAVTLEGAGFGQSRDEDNPYATPRS